MKSLTFELSHVGKYKRFGYGLQDNPIVYGRRLLMIWLKIVYPIADIYVIILDFDARYAMDLDCIMILDSVDHRLILAM